MNHGLPYYVHLCCPVFGGSLTELKSLRLSSINQLISPLNRLVEIKDLFYFNKNNAKQCAADSHSISKWVCPWTLFSSARVDHLNRPEIQGRKKVKEEISQRVVPDWTNHIIAERLVVFGCQRNLCTSAEACCWSQLSTLVEVNLGTTFKSSLTFNLDFWVGFKERFQGFTD